ncbi:MAG: glycosyltransferase family 4 protein [Chthoniobacterales bacterium]
MKSEPRMRIAIVSSLDWRTPPRHSGIRELIAASLADGLVARGLDVTLFATADSTSTAKLRAICPRPLREDSALDPGVWNLLHTAEVFARAHEFDVIHCHTDVSALAYTEMVDTPVVLTLHETPTSRQLPIFHRFARNSSYIAISEASKLPGLPYTTTILPGVPLEEYRLNNSPGDYLLFVGTIAPNRGLERIIEAADKMNVPLVVGGPIEDAPYFEKVIHPLASDHRLIYLGPISRERRNEIFGRALALVHLSEKPQPFRLSMVEAMACGTPVIALRSGSNLEIVQHRKTGYLVTGYESLIEAIGQVRTIDRRQVRQRVIDHFSQNGMVTQYLRIYETAIKRAREKVLQEESALRGQKMVY